MEYYSFEVLKKYVGQELVFEGVCRVKTGVLEYDKGKLWKDIQDSFKRF